MKRSINFMFLGGIVINFVLWYGGIALVGSTIKNFGDCGQTYKIDKYINTNWFCQSENDRIDMQLANMEQRRTRRK